MNLLSFHDLIRLGWITCLMPLLYAITSQYIANPNYKRHLNGATSHKIELHFQFDRIKHCHKR